MCHETEGRRYFVHFVGRGDFLHLELLLVYGLVIDGGLDRVGVRGWLVIDLSGGEGSRWRDRFVVNLRGRNQALGLDKRNFFDLTLEIVPWAGLHWTLVAGVVEAEMLIGNRCCHFLRCRFQKKWNNHLLVPEAEAAVEVGSRYQRSLHSPSGSPRRHHCCFCWRRFHSLHWNWVSESGMALGIHSRVLGEEKEADNRWNRPRWRSCLGEQTLRCLHFHHFRCCCIHFGLGLLEQEGAFGMKD